MFISQAFAQAAGASALGGAGGIEQFLPIVLIFVVFYFLLLRPQQKKAKQHREMVSALRRGDRVITQGGLHGTINKVIDDAVVLVEFADNVRFRVSRSSITEVLAKTEPVSTAKAKDDAETKEDGQAASVADAPKAEEKSSSILGKLLGRK